MKTLNPLQKDGLLWLSDVISQLSEVQRIAREQATSQPESEQSSGSNLYSKLRQYVSDLVELLPPAAPENFESCEADVKVWQFAEWVSAHPLKNQVRFVLNGKELSLTGAINRPATTTLVFQ